MAAQLFDLVDDLSQMPRKRDAIEQGATFGWVVSFEAADTDGTAPEDWSARMQVRTNVADKDTGDPLLDLDTEPGGGITLTIGEGIGGDLVHLSITTPAAATTELPIGKWWYDLELERVSDGYVRRICKGRAQVVGEVTR